MRVNLCPVYKEDIMSDGSAPFMKMTDVISSGARNLWQFDVVAEISPPVACPKRRPKVTSRMGRNDEIYFRRRL